MAEGDPRGLSSRILVLLSEILSRPVRPGAPADTRSSTSQHRTVDLASGLSGYAPLLWENENDLAFTHAYNM